MDYHQFNQVVIPIAAAITDAVLLLSKLTHTPVPCMQPSGKYFLSPFLSIKSTKTSLISAGKAKNIPSLFYLKGISTLEPYIIIQFAGILTAFPFHKEITLVYYIADIIIIGSNEQEIVTSNSNLRVFNIF